MTNAHGVEERAQHIVDTYLDLEEAAHGDQFPDRFCDFVTALMEDAGRTEAWIRLPANGLTLYAERRNRSRHVALYRGHRTKRACRAWSAPGDRGLLDDLDPAGGLHGRARLLAELFAPASGVAWTHFLSPAIRESRRLLFQPLEAQLRATSARGLGHAFGLDAALTGA